MLVKNKEQPCLCSLVPKVTSFQCKDVLPVLLFTDPVLRGVVCRTKFIDCIVEVPLIDAFFPFTVISFFRIFFRALMSQ